eukprot:CAMPEP_0182590960 /NCGR_PEP_ID=MMETSP1324-20130603/72734_1 /TAXON_ID=236786 /ORGANISM="Florenciella sp., Strain RCC1587" /LENGTH=101 /DNA_ID=CAMNT_0024808207 /DNA_START=92 /DNA_END=397 /DNA_ORIENTATION=+
MSATAMVALVCLCMVKPDQLPVSSKQATPVVSIDHAEAPITGLLRGSEATAGATDREVAGGNGNDEEIEKGSPAGVTMRNWGDDEETEKPREPLINVSVQG